MQTATFKLCIFGDGGVGKTSLVHRYVTGRFDRGTRLTIGVEIVIKRVKFLNWNVTLQIWDFGGEDRFRFFLPTYARGSFAGIYMYDITRFKTLMNFDEWLNVFKKGANYDLKPIPIIMVGGKLDLQRNRAVKIDEAQNFAFSRNIFDIIECSSKTGENVESIFTKITHKTMENVNLI